MAAFGSVPGLVALLLLLGAIVFLRHKRYIRRRPAYVGIAVLILAILFTAYSMTTVTV